MDRAIVTLPPEVEAWFTAVPRPAEAALRRVTDVILDADPRMSAYLKWDTVQFAYLANMAAFVQHRGKVASLMFMRGGAIPGAYPHMQGEGREIRKMHFRDAAEVDAHADELRRVTRAWCELMDAEAAR